MNMPLFGTDGIRATVGISPCTQEELIALGSAIGQFAHKKYKKSHPNIMIAHDTRISCGWIKACLSTGLLRFGIKIHDAHVLPTPAALVLMQEYSLLTTIDCAVVISASHNPFHDNGIKIIDQKGKLSSEEEHEIEQFFYEYQEKKPQFDARMLGHAVTFENAESLYCAKIASYFEPSLLQGLTVVLDCAHGATYRTAPRIFKKLGAHVISINNQPTGYNINEACGSTHPESLQQAVIAHGAHLGCAFDGDGDRLLLVNRHGEIKDGDDCLALLAQHPRYCNTTAVVGTLMANYGLEEYLNKQSKKLVRTHVGDKHVMQQIKALHLMIGGEASGHVICSDLLMAGDGVIAALCCIESIKIHHNWDMSTFERTPSTLINIRVAKKHDMSQEPFAHVLRECEKRAQPGRIVVRYSGTEPLLRILIETPIQKALDDAKNIIEQQLTPLLMAKE